MDALILSFRRGRHTQKTNQFLIAIEGVDSKDKAKKFIGTKLIWTSPAKKEITGSITALHGSKGVLRARFSRGLPGDALRKPVKMVK